MKDLVLTDCGERERGSKGRKGTALSRQEKSQERDREEFSLYLFPSQNTTEEEST